MYNPDGRDPAFDQMVLLGHSMGGLLSHMMTVDSGDKLWQLNSDRPFDEILGPPEVLDELQHYLFFEPLPFVKRVVFLATPHRGSDLSRGMVGRVGSSLITEPDHISQAAHASSSRTTPTPSTAASSAACPPSIETLEPRLADPAGPAGDEARARRGVPLDHRLAPARPASHRRPTASSPTAAPTSTASSPSRSSAPTTASRRTPRRSGRSAASSCSTSASSDPGARPVEPAAVAPPRADRSRSR